MIAQIHLPDDLRAKAERVARHTRISFEQLVAEALQAYLDNSDPATITAQFNVVYATESSELDPALQQMAFLSLDTADDWTG